MVWSEEPDSDIVLLSSRLQCLKPWTWGVSHRECAEQKEQAGLRESPGTERPRLNGRVRWSTGGPGGRGVQSQEGELCPRG